jgi:hypothetical protein
MFDHRSRFTFELLHASERHARAELAAFAYRLRRASP